MELNPFSEATSRSASQETSSPCLGDPPLDLVLNQM